MRLITRKNEISQRVPWLMKACHLRRRDCAHPFCVSVILQMGLTAHRPRSPGPSHGQDADCQQTHQARLTVRQTHLFFKGNQQNASESLVFSQVFLEQSSFGLPFLLFSVLLNLQHADKQTRRAQTVRTGSWRTKKKEKQKTNNTLVFSSSGPRPEHFQPTRRETRTTTRPTPRRPRCQTTSLHPLWMLWWKLQCS